MKRLLFIAAFAAPAHAALVDIGVKVGAPLSSFSATNTAGTALDPNSYKAGFLVGVGAEVGLGPIGVIADALYARRGYGSNDTTMSRLEFPVQAKLSTGPVFFSGGLYYALGVGDLKSAVGSGARTSTDLAAAGFKKNDFGMLGGLGVSIPAGLLSVTFEARYVYGLLDLDTTAGEAHRRHRSIDLIAGLWF